MFVTEYDFSGAEVSKELMLFYTAYIGFFLIIALVFSVISYIFQGKGMYAIAKRRGIEKPWLAWVPVGNMWLLGCISDQFRYLSYGQNTTRRRKLMVLDIILIAVILLLCGLCIWVAVSVSVGEGLSLATSMLVVVYGMLAVAVVASVLQYKCYFDLFRSCDPSKSVLFLILSILVGYPLPFFVYACRNKDLGMPPRRSTETGYSTELPRYEEY